MRSFLAVMAVVTVTIMATGCAVDADDPAEEETGTTADSLTQTCATNAGVTVRVWRAKGFSNGCQSDCSVEGHIAADARTQCQLKTGIGSLERYNSCSDGLAGTTWVFKCKAP